jgi:hypothetical protein
MRVATILLALASAFAVAADNAAAAPRPATSSKPPLSTFGTESIAIPQLLSYQGKLTDTLGAPVSDTTYNVDFRLYTVPSGGSPYWSETQTIRTRSGLFSTLLGSVTPIGSVPDAGALYLGMAVAGGAELTPRLRIVSGAYAFLSTRTANADLLQGKDTTGFVRTGQTGSVTSAMIADGTIAAADLGQMGASTGQVMKWTGSAWAPRNDSLGSGGGGTVTSVSQATGVVCSPNPITTIGTVRLDTSYSDGRYIKNQFASNQFASWRIAGQGSCSANADSDAALKGTNASTKGYGVWGHSSDNYGVYGSTTSGSGVCGSSSASGSGVYGSSNSGDGVYGSALSGPGVYGISGSSHGVVGNSNSGFGVYGGSSGSCGVCGMSSDSWGVAGTSTSNDGVYGKSSASGHAGLYGTSTSGIGGYGVWGDDSLGCGVYGISYSNIGVYGNSTDSCGIVGRSAGSFGVAGISTNSYGAYDSSANSTGVFGASAGVNQSGVSGVSHGSGGTGVYGRANGSGTIAGVNGTASGSSTNYGVYGYAYNGSTNYAGYFNGDVTVTGNLVKGGGSFQIDHPLDPQNKYLYHSFVESPDMMNIYNGNVRTDARGYATVTLPNWFETLNRDFRYQLTVIDEADAAGFAQAKVVRGVKDNSFIIRTSAPLTTVSWQLTGIRQDLYANAHRIQVEVNKPARERGKYLHPELYGQPREAGIGVPPEDPRDEAVLDRK